MSKVTRRPRPDVPLAESSALLAELARRIDANEPLTPVFMDIWARAKSEHTVAVTLATTFADDLVAKTNGAKGARDRWAAKAKKLEEAHNAFKEVSKALVKAEPNLPWTDAYGGKVYVSANSQASLSINLSVVDKTVRNIIDQADAEKLGGYVKPVTYLVIDTDALRTDLAAGKKVPWATLERGDHVRGLNGSEPAESITVITGSGVGPISGEAGHHT